MFFDDMDGATAGTDNHEEVSHEETAPMEEAPAADGATEGTEEAQA